MNETLSLLRQLISCPSVTPNDAGCMDIVSARLEKHGFQTEWLDFEDTRNIWLRKGNKAPLFTFLGHTDVVPPGPLDAWTSPPFEPTVRRHYLYGRGAADMKSGVAAFITACERFCSAIPEPNGSISLLLTSDEEGIATHGVCKVIECLQARNEIIDWCLVGEPSSEVSVGDTIKIGRRGSLCGVLTVLGTQGHVAYPHLAENPVHRFAPILQALTTEVWDNGNEFFPPTSFQISNIQAGTGAENIIPGVLKVHFNLRFSSELDESTLRERVHTILDQNNLHYELNWRLSGNPFITLERDLIDATSNAILSVTGQNTRLETGGGTSDGRFVAPTGAQVVELGPSNESIHKVNEKVALEDVDTLSDIYEKILYTLLVNN